MFDANDGPSIQRCDECWHGVPNAPTDLHYQVEPECKAALRAELEELQRADACRLGWAHNTVLSPGWYQPGVDKPRMACTPHLSGMFAQLFWLAGMIERKPARCV